MKRTLAILIFLSAAFNLHSQDLVLLQTGQSLVYLKPSFCFIDPGFTTKSKIRYRDQFLFSSKQLTTKYVMENCATEVYLDPLRAGIELSYKRDAFVYGSFLRRAKGFTGLPQMGLSWDRLEIVPTIQFKSPKKNTNLEKFHDGETARTEQRMCM